MKQESLLQLIVQLEPIEMMLELALLLLVMIVQEDSIAHKELSIQLFAHLQHTAR